MDVVDTFIVICCGMNFEPIWVFYSNFPFILCDNLRYEFYASDPRVYLCATELVLLVSMQLVLADKLRPRVGVLLPGVGSVDALAASACLLRGSIVSFHL